ncbi:MAG: hypothetical protein U1C73_07625, partial [Dietzia sp.]|nr:hypothetical protein [Dietzia sp.]
MTRAIARWPLRPAGQQHDGAGLPPTTTPIDVAGSFLESWDVIGAGEAPASQREDKCLDSG